MLLDSFNCIYALSMMNVFHLELLGWLGVGGGQMACYYAVNNSGRQTSHLSPYCNEPMFRNSNYLLDRVTNDTNSSTRTPPTMFVCSVTSRQGWVRFVLTFNPLLSMLFLGQTSLHVQKSNCCVKQTKVSGIFIENSNYPVELIEFDN